MNQDHITISQIATALGISRQAVRKQLIGKMNSGEIEYRRDGKVDILKFNTLPQNIKDTISNSGKATAIEAKKMIDVSQKPDLEKRLWEAADKLRGNVDPSEYKYVVLGMIFLKFVSDTFAARRASLAHQLSDPKGEKYLPDSASRATILDSKEYYHKDHAFYVPETARWEYLQSKAALPAIDEYLDNAMDEIEKANPQHLAGILPKKYTSTTLEPQILGELINIFSKISFGSEDDERDVLGEVYEYFLGRFADQEGKRGGSFFTPQPLVKLLVEILEPFENSRVLDPAAGSGGMFVQSRKFIKAHHYDEDKISIYGQESNSATVQLCKMNLAIRGIFGKIEQGNTYYADKFPGLQADFVLANPPFNAEWDPDRLHNDPRTIYGTPGNKNANFMWIQHFLHHLAPTGMAGFVMANGALAVSGREGKIREKIVADDLVDVIIACPPKLFYNVALPVSLWFMTKNKEQGRFRNRKGETLFIDAREVFTPVHGSRKQVTFTDSQIEQIACTVRAWRGEKDAGAYKDIPGFCQSVKLEDIVKAKSVLTPGMYIDQKDEVDDGIPFADKMSGLTRDLSASFKESHTLEQEIKQNLAKIGFKL